MDLVMVDRKEAEAAVGKGRDRITVRDGDGQYWTWDGEGWRADKGTTGDAPEGRLEAPSLHLPIPAKEDETPLDPPAKDAPQRTDATVVDAVAAAVGRLSEAYREGLHSAEAAESTARDRLLVDLEGAVWTPGLQSGDWFACKGKAWKRHAAGPDPARLVRTVPGSHACPACAEAVDEEGPCPSCGAGAPPLLADVPEAAEGLVRFLEACPARRLPERVTTPWDPPVR